MRYTISLLILFFYLNQCLGGTIDPKVSDLKYLNYGQQHECVLKIRAISKNGDKNITQHGVCTLISPRIAITCAHVLFGCFESYVIDNDGKEVKIDYGVYPKAFEEDTRNKTGLSKNDIAICLLSEPISINFYPEIYRENDEVDKICSICGFGLTGDYFNGVKNNDTRKRAGSNTIDLVENGMIECSVGSGKKTSLEFLIAPGDSGGGLFINKKLAGVNCGLYTIDKDKKLNSDYKDKSLHVRISEHQAWIDAIIALMDNISKKETK